MADRYMKKCLLSLWFIKEIHIKTTMWYHISHISEWVQFSSVTQSCPTRTAARQASLRSVQFSLVTQSYPTLCDPMNSGTLGLPVHHHLPESTQTHVHCVSDAIQPSHHLLSPSPPSLNLSQHQGLFKWVSSPHEVAKILEFSFNISPSNEHTGLISFRMDWLHLLAAQGTRQSLLQHHTSKASILQHSAFFTIHLSHPYMTTGKTIALTRWIFVGKVMSLLFNMLSRLVITFLPRSQRLFISWLQSPYSVILEPPKIKSATVSVFPHLFAMNWWDWMPWS